MGLMVVGIVVIFVWSTRRPAAAAAPPGITGTPVFVPAVHNQDETSATALPTHSQTPTATVTRTPTPAQTLVPTATRTPTATQTARLTATPAASNPLSCGVRNIAWTEPGQLLRGGSISAAGFDCLADAGVDVLIDQRQPSEVPTGEANRATRAGLEYINLGIPDDRAPSPDTLQAWSDTVAARLAQGQQVLVYDAGGRGRMGFWDAVYLMMHGSGAAATIEGRYLAKSLPFLGAKIGCADGGNGQVQALAEIGHALTGVRYVPQVDEYGTQWPNCPRPAYMDGWDYDPLFDLR
jgi:hypothetical protein